MNGNFEKSVSRDLQRMIHISFDIVGKTVCQFS